MGMGGEWRLIGWNERDSFCINSSQRRKRDMNARSGDD